MNRQHEVFIALGTNLGDRQLQLAEARRRLAEAIHIDRVSPIYETDPWGYEDQPDFLNQVLAGRTDLAPEALLALVKSLEVELGRQPTFRNGPRAIDIDILVYDELAMQGPELTVPHPKLAERAFVLVPLRDIAPDLLVPGEGRTVETLYQELEDTASVRPWKEPHHHE